MYLSKFIIKPLHVMLLVALLGLLLDAQESNSTPLSLSSSIETADERETPLESAPTKNTNEKENN